MLPRRTFVKTVLGLGAAPLVMAGSGKKRRKSSVIAAHDLLKLLIPLHASLLLLRKKLNRKLELIC